MRKKCFKKTISLALCIVMSVTMTGTPVLADAFTDGSQSIISENAEIPTVDVESATNCGDVASTEENLTESALLSETEEKFDNPEYAEFSGGNDAEVVSEFSDNSVPAAQTEGNTVVYLDPNSGDDTNDGSSVENAVRTLVKAIKIANGGIIYLLNPIDISQNTTHPRVCGLQYPPKVDISNQHNPQGWAYRWHCGSSAFRPDAISAPTTVPGNPSGSPRFRDT